MKEKLTRLADLAGINTEDLKREGWRILEGYEHGYRVSSKGRVFKHRFKVRYQRADIRSGNCLKVRLRLPEGKTTLVRVDVLMFAAFAGIPDVKGSCVVYLDGNRLNLRLSNLAVKTEWLQRKADLPPVISQEELRHRRKAAVAALHQAEREEELRRILYIKPGGTAVNTNQDAEDDHWYDLAWVVLGMNCPYLPSSHFRGGYQWCHWELGRDAFEHDYED